MVFTTQAIGPAAMALRTDIRDSWIANICSDIYIYNNIRTLCRDRKSVV